MRFGSGDASAWRVRRVPTLWVWAWFRLGAGLASCHTCRIGWCLGSFMRDAWLWHCWGWIMVGGKLGFGVWGLSLEEW